MDPSLWELYEEGDGGDEVAAIMRLGQPDSVPAGVRVVARFGDIVTCRLKRESLIDVRGEPNVASLKAPRRLLRDLWDEPVEDEELREWVDFRRPDGIAEDGSGVVLGIVDWGFDFTHPDFRNDDGTTRIAKLWDQRGDSRSPNAYGYGTVYTSEDINRALRSDDPFGALNYHPADADDGHGAHATHVSSIAAGNGRAGGPVGLAPRAELHMVHMGSFFKERSDKLGDSVTLLEAIDFIDHCAAEPVIRPWVINLSMGRHGEQHDGTTLVEEAFDAILRAAPGRMIVQSAGNYFRTETHTSGTLRPGEERKLLWEFFESPLLESELEIWYSGRDAFDVALVAPDGKNVTEASLDERRAIEIDGKRCGTLHNRARDPNTLDNHVEIFLSRDAPAGQWEVVLRARNVVDGRFHAWIEREPVSKQSHFTHDEADPWCTTGTICNGLRTIAVGAYDAHSQAGDIARFSSGGPTRDGRVKPDLCAPGVSVLAARSTPREGEHQLLTRLSGTSMASPHVAGTVVLMFAAAQRLLRVEETRNLLLTSARAVANTDAQLNRFGSGYLDVEAAVAAARRVTPAHVASDSREELVVQETSPKPETLNETELAQDLSGADTVAGDAIEIEHEEFEALAFAGVRAAAAPAEAAVICDAEAFAESFARMFTQNAVDSAIESVSRIVDAADDVAADPKLSRNSRTFLNEVLERSGVAHGLGSVEPARIFDAYAYGRETALLERLEATFQRVALPNETLTGALHEGDVMFRRADGRFGHAAIIAKPERFTLRELDERGFTPESRRAGTYVVVSEGGARPHVSWENFARYLTDSSDRLPFNHLILRPREERTAREALTELFPETVDRRSPDYARWIQHSLNTIDNAGLAEDGIVGPLTRAATRRFQAEYGGLTVDGIVGPKTEAALIASGAPPPPGSDIPVPPQRNAIDPTRWAPLISSVISSNATLRTNNAVTYLIDGPATYQAMVDAIASTTGSGHYIYLLGWALKDNFEMLPGVAGSTFQRLSADASARGVQIRAMLWDQVGRQNTAEVARINALQNGAAILDDETPHPIRSFGAHHQKILVVKGSNGLIGFCGGLDINDDRINVTRSAGSPQHDVHARVMGPAAWDCLLTFRRRWAHHPEHINIDRTRGPLLGQSEPIPPPISTPAPGTSSTGATCAVAIARTFNPVTSGSGVPRERDIQTLLRRAISSARRFIYVEEQYLVGLEAAVALNAAIPHLSHLTILLGGSEISDHPCIWTYRRDFVNALTSGLSAPDMAKIRIFRLVTPPAAPPPNYGRHTYVHAKIWVFDDELAVIGSANVNRRGWQHDSEASAFIFDDVVPASGSLTFAQQFRMDLWSEHLSVPPAAVSDGVASASLWLAPPPGAKVLLYDVAARRDVVPVPEPVCNTTLTRDTIDPFIP